MICHYCHKDKETTRINEWDYCPKCLKILEEGAVWRLFTHRHDESVKVLDQIERIRNEST